jgi:hypothetical protein
VCFPQPISEAVSAAVFVLSNPAWPLSKSQESGTNINNSYYVLIAACILARKTEWLRNACLAAALIFPAIAAVHGIVLAALHIDGTSTSPRERVMGAIPLS